MKRRLFHSTKRRLEALEREVAALRAERSDGESSLLCAEAREAGVPLSQVIQEYLWGEEDDDA
jgi:hypothetical protein